MSDWEKTIEKVVAKKTKKRKKKKKKIKKGTKPKKEKLKSLGFGEERNRYLFFKQIYEMTNILLFSYNPKLLDLDDNVWNKCFYHFDKTKIKKYV